jgi:hypothetical protein
MNVRELLEDIKKNPYEEIEVVSPHCGYVEFAVEGVGAQVSGPTGTWGEKPGTVLAYITRENNRKSIHATLKGTVDSIEKLGGKAFVQAGQKLLTIRHYLSRDEVIDLILRRTLHLFEAPERAKYYFVPEIDMKVKAGGLRAVTVKPGEEVFIMSRMKRETPVAYDGPEGLIYSVYFKHDENVEAGAPLIGVCPPDQVDHIRDVINQVRGEWRENGQE